MSEELLIALLIGLCLDAFLHQTISGAKRIMDACKAQGVEAPTWSSDGGFVTITFKRPYFKASMIETEKEDNRTSKQDNLRSSSAQVPLKFKK